MVSVHNDHRKGGTDENQGGVEIFVVFLDVHVIVLVRLLLVHGVEIELGIIVLDGLEVHPQGLSDHAIDVASARLSLRPIQTLWNAPPRINIDIDRFCVLLATHRGVLPRQGMEGRMSKLFAEAQRAIHSRCRFLRVSLKDNYT